MNNYYEYCRNISKEYYPKIFIDLNKELNTIIDKIDKDKLHPFPRSNVFEELVEEIFKNYKKDRYNEFIEGKSLCVNFNNTENISLIKDIIRILLINEIIKRREVFKDYPYYY